MMQRAPTDYDVLRATVDILSRLEHQDKIVDLFSALLKDIPPTAEGYDLLSYAFYKAKRYEKAIEYGELGLGSTIDSTQTSAIRYNLGKCYQNANYPTKAINAYSVVTLKNPDRVDVKLDLSVALYSYGKKEEAEAMLRELLTKEDQMAPRDYLATQFNLGVHELARGNFKQGMEYLQLGRKLRIWGSYTSKFNIPEWDGTPHPGKSVIIVGEGGIGDEVINARFVKHIKDMGMECAFASCQGLSKQLERMPFDSVTDYTKWTTAVDNISNYDYWTPAMNLPYTLGIDSNELWYGPYLKTDPAYDTKWQERTKTDKIKVGIRWSGNPLYEQDLHRTIPVEELLKCLPPDRYEIYSLQRDSGVEDLKSSHVHDLSKELVEFDDLWSAVNAMDIVISSCTSVAHVAGALGKRTYILSPLMAYYTWAEDKTTTVWYGDNMTVIKQAVPRDWNGCFNVLKEFLDK